MQHSKDVVRRRDDFAWLKRMPERNREQANQKTNGSNAALALRCHFNVYQKVDVLLTTQGGKSNQIPRWEDMQSDRRRHRRSR